MCYNEWKTPSNEHGSANVAVEAIRMILFSIINGKLALIRKPCNIHLFSLLIQVFIFLMRRHKVKSLPNLYIQIVFDYCIDF